MIDPGAMDATLPRSAPPTPKIFDLGNGYSLVTYDDGSGAPPHTQIIANKNLDAGAGSDHYATNVNAAQNAADLAEKVRQFNETLWDKKAAGDRDALVNQGLLDVNRGNLGVSQGRLALDQLTQQQNYYKYLSDVAANPRNFVQTFFMNRGATPPADVARYGNAPAAGIGGPAMALAGPPAAARIASATGPAAPSAPAAGTPPLVGGSNASGAHGHWDPGDETHGARFIAMARGGVVPEPVVGIGLHSGQTYKFGEQGPEGVVPAQYLPDFLKSRHGTPSGGSHGYADGGVIGSDPYSGLSGFSSTGKVRLSPTDPDAARLLAKNPSMYEMTSPTAAAPYLQQLANQGNSTKTYAPGYAQPTRTTQWVQTPSPVAAPAPPTGTANINPVTGQPYTFNDMNPGVAAPGGPNESRPLPGLPGTNPYTFQDMNPHPDPRNYLDNTPAEGRGYPGVPGDWASPDQMTQYTPPLNPLLPSNPGKTLDGLLRAGALPPFLSRLFEQNRSNPAFGTNTPQRSAFPTDVPLASSLAFTQMSPSEQQALLSYASSYGVDPTDYLNQITQASPQRAPYAPHRQFLPQ